MKKVKLGQTGIEVSPITIGAWQLGGPLFFDGKPDGHPDPGKDNVIHMIRDLGELGINAIDTAEQYSAGESEKRVGEAIQGKRDKWVVSTKFGYRVGRDGNREDDSSPGTIMHSLEGSLRRLKTDYLDVYLYHCAPQVKDIEVGREVLTRAKDQGKIRSYGISTNNIELLKEMEKAKSVEVVQFANHMCQNRLDIWELAKKNNWGTQIRGVMYQGRLSGKYFDKAPDFKGDDNRSKMTMKDNFVKYAALREYLPEGMSMSQAVVLWTLLNDQSHTICLGAKTLKDYKNIIDGLNHFELPVEVGDLLEREALKLNAAG